MSVANGFVGSFTLYVGSTIFLSGMVGNLLNIRLLWRTRHNPCVFLFLISSVINCLVLFMGLLARILSASFNVDWSRSNLVWCKIQIALTSSSALMSLTLVCLTSIDRVFLSSRQERIRKLSQLRVSIVASFVTIVFWLLHSIPQWISAQLVSIPSATSNSFICTVIWDAAMNFYQLYIGLLVYLGLCPTVILAITGLITYRNTKQLQIDRQRHLIQRQLTWMLLLQIPIIIFSTLPYVIFVLYSVLTINHIKSAKQQSIETIVSGIISVLFYVAFSCQFFVFFFSSPNFRQETKRLFCCQNRVVNQVQPFTTNVN